jgi:hypothetical protein
MLAVLFGIDDATVLKFVEDEEGPAFGILIEVPLVQPVCPTCSGSVRVLKPVIEELPPTTAGAADLLIQWKRRWWRCANADCPQEPFGERNQSIETFVKRITPKGRWKRRFPEE